MKKYINAQMEEIEGEKLFIASDETRDRSGEIISVDGWSLENYKKNPIILWGHNALEPPIGKAEKIGYKTINGKKRLVFEPKFHRKDERSRLIGDLIDEGYLNEVSVGFIPQEYDKNIITESELLEISFVNNACNPSASRLSYDFALSKGYNKEIVKEVITIEPDETDEVKEIKELKDKINLLEDKIKSLETAKSPVDIGRNPMRSKKETDRRIALKALNKVLETINKLEK